jgi:hypothetical protein
MLRPGPLAGKVENPRNEHPAASASATLKNEMRVIVITMIVVELALVTFSPE